ncbi:MAG TPA: hypothetical protein VG034_25085 [Acidimicrobiia bacterium]|jgi:hypothetical protein|nr:hypothetical protein [Acidimicrobiia bacterium]
MRRTLLVAPGLALLAALAAVFLPLQQRVVSQSGPGPLHTLELEYASRSLLQTEGASILLAAGLPVLVALLPLAFAASRHARRAEIFSAVLLSSFVVVAGFSIGLFYLPAALAAILVARRSRLEALGG